LGYALAVAGVRFAGADLGAGFFRGVLPELALPWGSTLAFILGGIAMAVAGALLPALDAARTAPAQALKAGDEQRMVGRVVRLWPGIVLLLFSIALLGAGPWNGIPVAGYLSIASLLVGGIWLMPFLAEKCFLMLKTGSSTPYTLALAQLRGSPGQAIVSLAAIVASFSLMAAMAIMVASFRTSVDDWLAARLPAQLYFTAPPARETAC